MRKFIVLPLLVLLAACAGQTAVGPNGDEAELLAAKGGKGKGGGGSGGGGEALPSDVAAIVFVKRSGLFVMNADGANQTKVYGTVGVATPSWSPGGKSIVFHEWIDGQDWIRTIDITIGDDGGVSANGPAIDLLQCIPYFGTSYANCHPAWSPSGDQIAIADGMSRPASIRIVDLDGSVDIIAHTAPSGWWGSPERKVYNAVRWPTWSPSGDRIAFVEDGVVDGECIGSGGGVCISIIALNGNRWDPPKICPLHNTLVGAFAFAGSLEWARTAESNTLVFSGVVYGEEGGIFMLNTDNCEVSGPIVIDGRGPVWSAEDNWIAWVRGRNDQLMLYSNATRNSYKVASSVRDPDWHRIQRTN